MFVSFEKYSNIVEVEGKVENFEKDKYRGQ